MSTNAERAVVMFAEGFNCAQSVLACCGGPLGIPHDVALRVAGPFGGGMARTGRTCGAVTGALMTIGLKYARTRPGEEAAREMGNTLAREFLARFEQRHRTTCCRELLGGIDLGTPRGVQQAREAGLFATLCPRLVRDAAELVDELLVTAPPR